MLIPKGPKIHIKVDNDYDKVDISMNKRQAQLLFTMLRHCGGRSFNYGVTHHLIDAFREAEIDCLELSRDGTESSGDYRTKVQGDSLHFHLNEYE